MNDFEELANLDYRSRVRSKFDRCEIKQMILEARRSAWPRLNDEPVKLVSPTEFTRHWSSLGVEFKLAKLSSPEGLALMGFYIRKTPGVKRPMICVNTAHHGAVIGAAFAHEMGHHLTADWFGSDNEPQFMLYTGYAQHLEEPSELAADILVSLGVFPFQVAQKSFKRTGATRAREYGGKGRDSRTCGMLDYFAVKYGLNVDPRLGAGRGLQYLAGMLHYTKLREALMEEYDV
jgi:hypothetical protein